MPYAYTTRQNPSVSAAPSLQNRTSLSYSQLAPDHSASARNLFGFPPQSFQCRVPYNTIPRTSAPRAVSSMVVDKPLKSSLRYSTSWDYRDAGRNAPSANRKRVRFKDIGGQLESVCVYSATGRPSAMFSPYPDGDSVVSSDDDYDDLSLRMQRASITTAAAAVPLEVADVISQIPSPHTPLTRDTKVRLESISFVSGRLEQGQPLLLRGTVRVRNVAYEKLVAAHYTLDGWDTASEVRAHYVDTRGAPAARRYGAPANGSGAWDRFAFTIPLALRAPPCTLLLVVRFAVADVGEWWDNNGGEDFRIVLRPAPAGSGMPRPPGIASGSGPSSSSVRDRSFVNAAAADFPRQPLASCSANAQAAMAGAFPSMTPYAAPVPAAVTNRWLHVA